MLMLITCLSSEVHAMEIRRTIQNGNLSAGRLPLLWLSHASLSFSCGLHFLRYENGSRRSPCFSAVRIRGNRINRAMLLKACKSTTLCSGFSISYACCMCSLFFVTKNRLVRQYNGHRNTNNDCSGLCVYTD